MKFEPDEINKLVIRTRNEPTKFSQATELLSAPHTDTYKANRFGPSPEDVCCPGWKGF